MVIFPVIVLAVGNKSDREDRCVSTEEAKQLADDLKISFVETSAKDNCNVEQVSIFVRIVVIIIIIFIAASELSVE